MQDHPKYLNGQIALCIYQKYNIDFRQADLQKNAAAYFYSWVFSVIM
jgi:hypothetical protein